MRILLLSALALGFLVPACSKGDSDKSAPTSPGSSGASSAASSAAPQGPPKLIERDAEHIGGVLARAPGTNGVYIADEDLGLVRWVSDTSPLIPTQPRPPKAAAAASASASASASAAASASASASGPPRARSSASGYPSAAPVRVPVRVSASAAASASASASAGPSAADTLPPEQDDYAVQVNQETLVMGGAPANLVALRDGVLVTVRDPGKLVRVRKDNNGKLVAAHEVALAADAWGLAVNEAGTRALVTSAWTNTVSLVAIADDGLRKCAEVKVGREPRGVAFASDKVAYVNHLVGNTLTRLSLRDECDEKSIEEAKPLVLAPSPTRSPAGTVLPASLGYSLALSPDAKRLFVPRQALGARAAGSWFGATTVDVLGLPDEVPTAPKHEANLPGVSSDKLKEGWQQTTVSNEPAESWSAYVQPRDIRYRRRSGTVIVVSEGADRLVEMDAEAMDPSFAISAVYELNDSFRVQLVNKPETGHVPMGARRAAYVNPSEANASGNNACAAPQGLVFDMGEDTALVFCRASTTLARIRLQKSVDSPPPSKTSGLHWAVLGEDPAGKGLNLGKRLFYSTVLAEGMGCAGCHPEGRDDGHVWREVKFEAYGHERGFLGGPEIFGSDNKQEGVPRRTPMLVGRVLPVGPYGWRGESETLEARIKAGTTLHSLENAPSPPEFYINAVSVFLRKGLPKPPALGRELTAEEQKGKAIFSDAKTNCVSCHEPTRYFSNQTAMRLPALPTLQGFAEEPDAMYKTPSLLYVGHHGSLFHDGSAKDLEQLIATNGVRMGDTAHLTPAERQALVAYLKTL